MRIAGKYCGILQLHRPVQNCSHFIQNLNHLGIKIPRYNYHKLQAVSTLVYGSIYRSVFIEEILENDKYDTVEKLLKLKPEQYVKFLEYIVDVIINRNKQLQDILQEGNVHE